jgi:aspartyl protease family protein
LNIESAQLPNLIYLSLLLAVLFVSFVLNNRSKMSDIIKQIIIWLLIILISLLLYSFRYELYKIKDRLITELFPSKIIKIDDQKIAITSSNDGHFYIDIMINRQLIRFMVDTGASDIVLSLLDAKKVGIDVNNLSSFRQYQTANGLITNGLAEVQEIDLVGIKFYNVSVAVNSSDMGTSLLGMSFLKRFKKYEFYQNRLVLTH